MIYIGIDPGTHTGLAVWNANKGTFEQVETLRLHEALDVVRNWHTACTVSNEQIQVIFEDARQRKWYTGNTQAKLQGAGSIKRDCSIWEEFCTDYKLPFQAIPPRKGMTKVSEDYFRVLTKWQGRTSNHARDAAMLVLGR